MQALLFACSVPSNCSQTWFDLLLFNSLCLIKNPCCLLEPGVPRFCGVYADREMTNNFYLKKVALWKCVKDSLNSTLHLSQLIDCTYTSNVHLLQYTQKENS